MGINDGGPAFPIPGMANLPNGEFLHPHDGMTLRDYFAAKAMHALLSATWPKLDLQAVPAAAYAMADAMLAARAKS